MLFCRILKLKLFQVVPYLYYSEDYSCHIGSRLSTIRSMPVALPKNFLQIVVTPTELYVCSVLLLGSFSLLSIVRNSAIYIFWPLKRLVGLFEEGFFCLLAGLVQYKIT